MFYLFPFLCSLAERKELELSLFDPSSEEEVDKEEDSSSKKGKKEKRASKKKSKNGRHWSDRAVYMPFSRHLFLGYYNLFIFQQN